jgi:hypothetical protein
MVDGTDAFGHALRDWARGETDPEVFERDDGFTEPGVGHELYVAPFARWLPAERRAMRYVRGRVVDVGCAAGRVPLYLQQRGVDVVGVDSSPLAVRTARARGVAKRPGACRPRRSERGSCRSTPSCCSETTSASSAPPARVRRVLTSWARRTRRATRILARQHQSLLRWGAGSSPGSYYFGNRQRGLMPGQVRLRIRYQNLVSAWFSWLFVSRREMSLLLRGTGWHQSRILGGASRQPYVAVLEKD